MSVSLGAITDLIPHVLVLFILLITIIYFSQDDQGKGKTLFCTQPAPHIYLSPRYNKPVARL